AGTAGPFLARARRPAGRNARASASAPNPGLACPLALRAGGRPAPAPAAARLIPRGTSPPVRGAERADAARPALATGQARRRVPGPARRDLAGTAARAALRRLPPGRRDRTVGRGGGVQRDPGRALAAGAAAGGCARPPARLAPLERAGTAGAQPATNDRDAPATCGRTGYPGRHPI